MNVFKIVDIIFYIIVIIVILLFVIIFIKGKKNHNYPKKTKSNKTKFAVLIPARDESKVIRGLLESIKNQSYKISMQEIGRAHV